MQNQYLTWRLTLLSVPCPAPLPIPLTRPGIIYCAEKFHYQVMFVYVVFFWVSAIYISDRGLREGAAVGSGELGELRGRGTVMSAAENSKSNSNNVTKWQLQKFATWDTLRTVGQVSISLIE